MVFKGFQGCLKRFDDLDGLKGVQGSRLAGFGAQCRKRWGWCTRQLGFPEFGDTNKVIV